MAFMSGHLGCKEGYDVVPECNTSEKGLKAGYIIKLEKGVKAKIELLPLLDKVIEISLWMMMKKNKVVDLLSVVGFELEATKVEFVNMNKNILHVASKVKQVRVVFDTMMRMKNEQEKKLELLLKTANVETSANDLQLVTYDFYRKMVMKQVETIVELLVEQAGLHNSFHVTNRKVKFLGFQFDSLTTQLHI
jgi:hypothetical protein